jgi:membrane-bound serine protease (ClpP class)
MITLRGTVDSAMVQRATSAMRDAVQANAEIVLFDIQVGTSDFGACYDLANNISQIGGSVKQTVAYVSKPLAGNGILLALACDEVVFASQSTIGDPNAIGDWKARERSVLESLAVEKGHGRWIALGLTDKSVQLVEVETANGKSIKSAADLPEFEKSARILKKEVIKEAGQPWVITADLGRRIGFVRLVRETRKEVALAYGLSETVAAEDATFQSATLPMILKIEGVINQRMLLGIQRRLNDAQRRGSTMLFVEIDSSGGEVAAAASLMSALDRWPGYKVAWVPTKATGAATLVVFGCQELVMGSGARVGEFVIEGQDQTGAGVLADGAVDAVRDDRFSEAVVRGLIDRSQAVYEVRGKENASLVAFRTEEELAREDVAADWVKGRQIKEAGSVLTVTGGEQARSLDLAVGSADTLETLAGLYAIQERMGVLQPTWVDGLVDGLTSPGVTVFLLVVGMTCLYIEFQMPGFGIGGLISAICFVLFFWARFLSETANSLEVVMFLLGLVLLAIELFVLPGFGIAGVTGILLVLASLILASQSFPWPTSASETRVVMGNVVQLAASLALFLAIAIALARFFPSIPMVSRLILKPPIGEMEEFVGDPDEYRPTTPYDDLLGQTGLAASPLRPAGRMKIGDRTFDVITGGEFVEPGRPIEVVEVYPNRIVVRPVPS